MERASNRCPFMMGSERMVDPTDDSALWVTVELDPVMKFTHDNEKLMEVVIAEIRASNAAISPKARHYHEPMCLSLPVVGFPVTQGNEQKILEQAETLATWWLGEIQAQRVQLDRKVIFTQQIQEFTISEE